MLVLFMKFVDKGFVRMVIYCILCFVILSFNLNDLRRMARNTKYKLRALRSKRQNVNNKKHNISINNYDVNIKIKINLVLFNYNKNNKK